VAAILAGQAEFRSEPFISTLAVADFDHE